MRKLSFRKMPTGYGTWILYVDMDQTMFSAITSNKQFAALTEKEEEGIIEAIRFVLGRYGYGGKVGKIEGEYYYTET